jgi:hypothetical protein
VDGDVRESWRRRGLSIVAPTRFWAQAVTFSFLLSLPLLFLRGHTQTIVLILLEIALLVFAAIWFWRFRRFAVRQLRQSAMHRGENS